MWMNVIVMQLSITGILSASQNLPDSHPEGFFPFEESPARIPPKVRKPPYAQTDIDCPGLSQKSDVPGFIQSLENLCGDLNKGFIPRNPMGHQFDGQAYPFDLIRNKTLDFFSSTLPFLKEDPNIPKVAKYDDFNIAERLDTTKLNKRQREDSVSAERQLGRGLCQKNYGIVCTLYNIFNGRQQANQDRFDNPDLITTSSGSSSSPSTNNLQNFDDDPVTPCPSAAEYVTPAFAKNYQGVWKYVVQIPFEGYFTQTVEIAKCLRKKCHFINGSCLVSARWLSLLVAELYYPSAKFPAKQGNVPTTGKKPSPPVRTKRESDTTTTTTTTCDGYDDTGCYQVRLYYDWFLVPGSCKCWKQDFFSKYLNRRT